MNRLVKVPNNIKYQGSKGLNNIQVQVFHNMQRYKIVKQIGEGAFSKVFLGQVIKTNQPVAIKQHKTPFDNWDEATNLRELRALMKIKHECVIKLYEVVQQNNILYMIFEYAEGNILDFYLPTPSTPNPSPISQHKIKSIIYQVLCGLQKIHSNGFVHRDLKPQNILVLGEKIKIADFGLARQFRSIAMFTQYISTRWYRAPQLIVEMKRYSTPVDIFALGCLLAELYNGKPLFPGQSQMDQLALIFKRLKIPDKEDWPDFYRWCLKTQIQIPTDQKISNSNFIERQIKNEQAQDLLKQMLEVNPRKRPSALKLLSHPFFHEVKTDLNKKSPEKKDVIEKREIENEPYMLKRKLKTKVLSTNTLNKIFASKFPQNQKKIETDRKQENTKSRSSMSQLERINNYRKKRLMQTQQIKAEELKNSLKQKQKKNNKQIGRAQYFYGSKQNRDKSVSKSGEKKFKIHSKSQSLFRKTSYFKHSHPYYV